MRYKAGEFYGLHHDSANGEGAHHAGGGGSFAGLRFVTILICAPAPPGSAFPPSMAM